ncbi:protein Wnt-4 [Bradysia coprophila]|uniref:protein Wnt-4 n=1 Tax=Bradysia coprophila TaxID=38358 RepID=UPI00187D919E|nr:protein Wnt-4 [Bradysia coprophila]
MFLREKKEVCLVVCVLAIASYVNGSSSNSSLNRLIHQRNTIMALFSPAPKTPGPCRYLQATRRQNHQCRKDFGLPEAIKEARRLAVTHCEQQFRYDRWNCSIESRGKRNIFHKVYRETAFIHSIVAAALTYSIARACSEGKMTKCHCGKEKYPPNVKTSWMWGGCSDNGKHGKRMAKRFLDLHPSDGDQVSEILRHNSEVGILSAISTINEKCKCHGVSGSCSMKTCWRKLADFNTTASLLKVKYHEAIRKFPSNKSSRRSVPDWYFKNKEPTSSQSTSLFYLETSPTFCAVTKGRNCQHPENCAMLCCGRGYSTHLVQKREQCRCRFERGQCCHVICDYCESKQERYFCK